MLLYDRLLAHLVRFNRDGGDDNGLFDSLLSAPVYEISSVIPLMDSYANTEDLGISRRPPHERVWIEWSDDGPDNDGMPSADQIGGSFTRIAWTPQGQL